NPLLLNDPTQLYGTAFDMDAVMDFNDNLHMITVMAASGGYSVSIGDSSFAMFDVYTQDQGSHFMAQLIGRPKTFRGAFGSGTTTDPTSNQDNRPFASRSWDGHKLF